MKEANPGVLLVVEVGYKFQFYGEDAEIASRLLNIMCYPKGSFVQASIPVERLSIHVKRLVNAGHKVGVVRQTEVGGMAWAA